MTNPTLRYHLNIATIIKKRRTRAEAENATEKRCARCQTIRPMEDFHRDSNQRDGRRPYCKICASADATRRWAALSLEQKKAIAARRKRTPGQRKEERDRYRRANLDKWRKASRERHAKKKQAPVKDRKAAQEFGEIVRNDICSMCGARGPLDVDHIDPLAAGGAHAWENIGGLCPSCNSRKGTTSLLHAMLK